MGDGFMNGYIEGYREFPACNHVQDIGPENIGYTNGITWEGLPFEAEIYCYGEKGNEQKELAIIFPDIYVEEDDCEDYELDYEEISDDEDSDGGYTVHYKRAENNVAGFSYQMEIKEYSVLPIGMVDRGQETNFKILQWYLSYIEDLGLITFTSEMRSCAVFYYTDINGTDLVQIRTGLITNGKEEAKTDLTFRDFPYRAENKKTNIFKVVK